MTPRQAEIIQAIVQEFVVSGDPVGSQILVDKYRLQFSSATVRKEMSMLEQMGFLISPHTSAGRIPTDNAFEMYVSDLLKIYTLTLSERAKLEEFYKRVHLQLEKLLEATTQVLAATSQFAGVVLAPVSINSIIHRIELVSIMDNMVLMVMVSGSGSIFQKKIRLEKTLSQEDLYKISRFLNQRLKGYEVADLQLKGLADLATELKDLEELSSAAITVAQALIYNPPDQQVYVEGESQLFNRIYESFDETTAKKLIHKLEDRSFLCELFNGIKNGREVGAKIGIEIDGEKIHGISVLAKDYFLGGRSIGALGVIGLNRMRYDKLIPTIDYCSRLLSDVLSDLNELQSGSSAYLGFSQDDSNLPTYNV